MRQLIAASVVVLAIAAPASAAVEIETVRFNAPGPESGTNDDINEEYVFIRNTGERRVNMRGWKLHDSGKEHVFRFGDLTLGSGDYLYVHSGKGKEGQGAGCSSGVGGGCDNFYSFAWDQEDYVWENPGDTATLRRRDGSVASRCSYGRAARFQKEC
jgi:hypothetical protein